MRRSGVTVATALLAAVVVFVLLFPFSGIDTDPPVCFSVVGYIVPCRLGLEGPVPEPWFAVAGAVVAALLVGVGAATCRWDRGRRR